MVGQRVEADAAVRQYARHIRAGQAVDEKDQGDDRQGWAKRAARGFQQQGDTDAGRNQVTCGQAAGAQGQLLIENEQIGSTGRGDQP